MTNADIAELLAIAYVSYRSQCEITLEHPMSKEDFYEKYRDCIQDFRHLMHVDDNDRKLNG